MSQSILQKSLKLFEGDSTIAKKGTRRNIDKHSRRKKQILALNEKKEELLKKNLERNLKNIQLLNKCSVPSELSKKVVKLVSKCDVELEAKPKDEGTVFTEEDFQKFEAEYRVE